jgi:hypothetical protein
VLAALCLMAATGGGLLLARAYTGALEIYEPLAALRQGLAADAAEGPWGIARLPRAVAHHLVSGLLAVKQSDAVAYPAHVALAQGLEWAHAPPEATQAQWLKAGLHARDQEEAERVARALATGVAGPEEAAALLARVSDAAGEQPWSRGIRAVEAELVSALGALEAPRAAIP